MRLGEVGKGGGLRSGGREAVGFRSELVDNPVQGVVRGIRV